MKGISYRDRDFPFGQDMLALRTKMGLKQVELAQLLGVSRRAVSNWEAGNSYPKLEHFKQLIVLALQHKAFPAGHEAERIRALWQIAHQKVLLDEAWLKGLLSLSPKQETNSAKVEESLTGKDKPASLVLPFQPTTFVGRVTELAEIDTLLRDPACRLLTLMGPGGIGKTRLAFEVATHQMEMFQDGVVFIPLASVGTPNQVVSALGSSLNLSSLSQADPREQLLTYLRKRHTLLLLDNFEHVLERAEIISEILNAAPRVKIIVTSRERLNLSSEWLFDVGGLSYPLGGPSGFESPKNVADYSAVQLFIQRAIQMQPIFPLTNATLAMVASICQHLAGMPLAIELAAANLRVLSLAEIEQEIRSQRDTLTTTLRDVPARHRSLRAVFDHSWNLLSKPEQALFSRLAVFRGGCTATAAVQVSGATLPALLKLVDKSLLQPVTTKGHLEPRFALLEPLREYALEKLMAQGDADALCRSHASYYLALAEAAAANWSTPTVDSWLAQLDIEYDNLRAALQWARDGGDPTIGLQLAAVLRRFWRSRGYLGEGRVWFDELLALHHDMSDAVARAARLQALDAAAWLAADQYAYARAAQLFEQGMTLRRALGEDEGETQLLVNAAMQARVMGQYQRASELLEDAVARHRALGDRGSLSNGGLGYSLANLALVRREQGVFAGAAALLNECLELHRALEDREGIAHSLLSLGDLARDQGDVAGVQTYCEQCLTMFRELGSQWAIGFALNNLALAAYLEGNLVRAFTLIDESVLLFRRIQSEGSLAEVLITKGHILRAQGKAAEAYSTLSEALRFASAVGPRLFAAASMEGLAGVVAEHGQGDLAVRLLSAASTLRAQTGTPIRPVDQPAFERALQLARSALEPETFAALWSEAEPLSLDQIITGLEPSLGRVRIPKNVSAH